VAKRLVLIEDSPTDIKLISDVAQQICPDCRLEVFRDGSNALDFFQHYGQSERFTTSLILLDLHLPDVHGLDLLREIKGRESTRTLPVVVVTGTASPKMIDEVYRMGANSVIEKIHGRQESMDALTKTLDYWLNQNMASDAQSGK
jgi:two-component system response regulator